MNQAQEQIIDEILSRGVEEIFVKDHLAAKLAEGKLLRVKLGVDPTGPNIHLGHAIPLWKLRLFQDMGHTVVLIIGDFTAQIGDPSDKLDKRPLLTPAQVEANFANYRAQLGKILDLSKVEWRHNSEWLSPMTFAQVCKLAESFTVQQMLMRRNFKERYRKGTEISLREFLYPLMQGYDSVAVHADVELGGFDQLFNLQAGRVIQELYHQEPQDIMTFQMLEGIDGRKMSKSWGNVINIVDEPKDMFGKIMAIKDELISKYFLLATRLPQAEIAEVLEQLQKGANPKDIKLRLAKEVVALYHSKEAAESSAMEFNKVHKSKQMPSDIPLHPRPKEENLLITELIVFLGLAKSKSEAQRLVEQGGVKINEEVIRDWKVKITPESNMVVQVGARKFIRLE